MELFGIEIAQLYMYGLIIAGALTLLYVLFSDMADAGEGLPLLNPAVLLAFFTLFFAIAFLLERVTGMDSLTIMVIAAIAGVVLDILFYFGRSVDRLHRRVVARPSRQSDRADPGRRFRRSGAGNVWRDDFKACHRIQQRTDCAG